jgi:hypothetical protein
MAVRLLALVAAFLALSSCSGGSSDNCCPPPVTGQAPTGSYVLVGGQPTPATMTNIAVSVDASSNTLTMAYTEAGHRYVKTYQMTLEQ